MVWETKSLSVNPVCIYIGRNNIENLNTWRCLNERKKSN